MDGSGKLRGPGGAWVGSASATGANGAPLECHFLPLGR